MLLYNNITGLIMSRIKPDSKAQAFADMNEELSVVSESGHNGELYYINGNFTNSASSETEAILYEGNLNDFRGQRNDLLSKSDWTQALDSPLSDSKKTEWQTYRQQLRDMPQQDGFDPLNPVYPDEPS